jgi:preprotein translocase subunit SecF
MKLKWLKYRWLYFLISGLIIAPGVFGLIKWGIRPAIDFTGGTLIEIKSEKLKVQGLKEYSNESSLNLKSIQESGDKSILMRFDPISEEEKNEFIKTLEEKFGEVELVRFETLGPSLGRELLVKTGVGLALAVLGILIYVTLQFKDKAFGICAILAMLHDSFILIGSYSLLGHFFGVEVDSLLVTAVLTILSFSVHDTVVVYDRIRELMRAYPKEKFDKIADMAINQTLIRSINNSLTIIFMLISLVVFGGSTIRWFAVALLIGTIAGTYSSTFTAIPLLSLWYQLFDKK